MRDLAFAMIWCVLFPVALWSAHIGVLLWIWVALLSPNDQLYGFMSGVPFNKIAVFATLLAIVIGRDKKKFYIDSTIFAIICFLIVGLVSTYNSMIPFDISFYYFDKIYKEMFLALCICGLMWSRHRIHMAVLVLCISIGFTSVTEGIEVLLSGGGHRVIGAGSFGDNNGVALAVLLSIPLLYYSATYAAQKNARIILYSVTVISIFTVIGTTSRGGFIGLLVCGAFFVWNSKQKFAGLILAFFSGAVVLLAAPASWFERFSSIKEAGENSSFLGRVVAWKISTLIALDHPLFGGGYSAVAYPSVWYHYLPYIDTIPLISTPTIPPYPLVAHSIYFQVLGDTGFVGLFLFLFILLNSLRSCSKVRKLTRHRADMGWADDLARMLQISLVIYMISGGALSFAYSEAFWIIVAIVSRLRRTVEDLVKETGPARTLGVDEPMARGRLPEPAVARSAPAYPTRSLNSRI
jgi:probable O-glycosylation ligase (exosortase A-associated)